MNENTKTMHSMFRNASSVEVLDVLNWNTENVTNMSNMFRHASSLRSLNLAGWYTSNAGLPNVMSGEIFAIED